MTSDDVMHVKVDEDMVGLLGLKQIMKEIAADFGDRFDDEVGELIILRLKAQNYIPESSIDSYKKAIIREYMRFREKAVSDDITDPKIPGARFYRCCG